jgi:hypothetical protein
MAAGTTAIVPSAASMSVMGDDNPEPTHARLMHQKEQLLAAQTALRRLTVAIARVELVAPADTHFAAASIQAAVLPLRYRDGNLDVDRLVRAHMEFAEMAKRDLA